MLVIAVWVSLGMMIVAVGLTLFRMFKGPTLPDRVLALDTLAINAIAVVILFDILFANAISFEIALLISMMGFVSTVVLCKYLLSGDIIS